LDRLRDLRRKMWRDKKMAKPWNQKQTLNLPPSTFSIARSFTFTWIMVVSCTLLIFILVFRHVLNQSSIIFH
jgi:hypothetical protein